MTLLNAPKYDEQKENRRRNILVGSGIFIALMVVLSVGDLCWGTDGCSPTCRRSTG